MVTHPFLVGFLVAELPKVTLEREWDEKRDCPFSGKSFPLDIQPLDVQTFKDHSKFPTEEKLNAINITRSLATAYVMDQVDSFASYSRYLIIYVLRYFYLFTFLWWNFDAFHN